MKNELICYTGGSGVLGRHMPKTSISLRDRLESSVESHEEELRSRASGCEVFFHFAAMTSVEDCEKSPERAYQLNAEGSRRWLEASQRVGIKKLIFISTAHVYAPAEPLHKIAVTHPTHPRSAYAISKLKAEELLLKQAKGATLPELCIARVFSVNSKDLSPNFLVPALHRRAQNRDFSPIPGLDFVRDFLTPEEIIQKLLHCSDLKSLPTYVNICSGIGTSIRQVASEIFKSHGLDPEKLVAAPGRPTDMPWIVGEPSVR